MVQKILIDTIPKLESALTHTKQTTEVISNRYKLDPSRISEPQTQRQINAKKKRAFESSTSNFQVPNCATMELAAPQAARAAARKGAWQLNWQKA
jgi:hypothetical protein